MKNQVIKPKNVHGNLSYLVNFRRKLLLIVHAQWH